MMKHVIDLGPMSGAVVASAQAVDAAGPWKALAWFIVLVALLAASVVVALKRSKP